MTSRIHNVKRSILVAAGFALIALIGSTSAADQWFVLGEQDISAADPSVTIKSQGGRWDKDVKQVRIAVTGADVKVTKLVLSWDNRPDDTMTDVGTIKAGGQTAPYNAPGIKGRLTSATISYTIKGAKTAHLKVMGYD
jgi:hypothetical protein